MADKPIIEAICAVREQLTICNSAIGEAITTAVLGDGRSVLEKMRSKVAANYAVVKE